MNLVGYGSKLSLELASVFFFFCLLCVLSMELPGCLYSVDCLLHKVHFINFNLLVSWLPSYSLLIVLLSNLYILHAIGLRLSG